MKAKVFFNKGGAYGDGEVLDLTAGDFGAPGYWATTPRGRKLFIPAAAVAYIEVMVHPDKPPPATARPQAPTCPTCGATATWKQGTSKASGKPYAFWKCEPCDTILKNGGKP